MDHREELPKRVSIYTFDKLKHLSYFILERLPAHIPKETPGLEELG